MPDKQLTPFTVPLDGKLLTEPDPITIGKNFRTLKNLRYTDTHVQGIAGMTKINSTALSSYPKIRSMYHFKKDKSTSESHVLVQAWNSGETGSKVYENDTAIPSAGDFNATAVYSDASGAGTGRFSDAPGGSVAYCNGEESLVYGGDRLDIGSFIVFHPDGSFRYDYTDRVRNTINTSAESATIHQATGGQDANCLLLMHLDNAVTDAVGTHSPSNNGVSFSTTGGKFSYYGDFEAGDSDYISIGDHADFDFSGGEFTIDLWIKVESLSDRRIIWYQETDNNNYFNFHINTAGRLKLEIIAGGAEQLDSGNSFLSAAGVIATGTWYHVALVENGDDWYFFVNGEIKATLNDSTRAANYTDDVNIGRETSGSTKYFDGKMDEIRVSDSARWTDNFTVATEAYSANNEGHFYIGVPREIDGFRTVIQNANTETSSMVVYYWDGADWASVSGLSDGTADGGVSLAQTGWATWTWSEGDAKTRFVDGIMLYWYKVSVTVVSSAVRISHCSVSAPMQAIKDIWDGITRPVLSFMAWNNTAAKYEDWTYNVYEDIYDSGNEGTYADLDDLSTSDYLVIGSFERLTAVSISIPQGLGNTTTNTNLNVYYWTGTQWQTVGSITDRTSDGNISFAKSGLISWNDPGESNEFKRDIGQNLTLYYYKFAFDSTLSGSDTVWVYYVSAIPAQKTIDPYKFPIYGQNRIFLCNATKGAKNSAIVCAVHAPDVWNGDDTTEFFFGKDDDLVAGASLYNQLGLNLVNVVIFCKTTETWMVTGTSPDDWVQYQASNSIGCVAPLTMTVISLSEEATAGVNRNIAIWQSGDGIWMFDGRGFTSLHGDIRDVFDQQKSTAINQSKIDKSVGWYDYSHDEWHWAYAEGTSTTLNKEKVFDLRRMKWYDIDRGTNKYLQAACFVTDTSGNNYHYGCIDTGYMERLDNGTDFDGTDITHTLQNGDVALANGQLDMVTCVRKLSMTMVAKTTTTNSVTVTHYGDSATSGTDVSLSPTEAGHRLARPIAGMEENKHAVHSFKAVMVTDDETIGFEPIAITGFYKVERERIL